VGGAFPAQRYGHVRASLIGALIAVLMAAVTLILPTEARSAVVISGVRIQSATASSFTVTLNSLGAGWTYRVYASTNRPDIYYDNLAKAPHISGVARAPRIGVGGLRYTTKPVWYRVQATKATHHRTSDIFSVGLKPTTPTGLTVTRVKGAMSLSWGGGAASGAQVQQATNSSFTAEVRTYKITGSGRQLTPARLVSGTAYWFRVRSVNVNTPSGFTAAVSATPSGRGQDLRVMTYNILSLSNDGTQAAGGTISPWSRRRSAVASYINQVKPDLIGIQEGASWTGAVRGPRQVDDLVKVLGGTYGLAMTETPPSQPGYFRVGSYLLYKKSTWSPVGNGGHWNIGTMPQGGSRYGTYQVLRHRTNDASVLFVTTHLYTSGGLAGDRLRQQETESLIARSRALAAEQGGLPIVYTGDFNSHELHPLDGPAVAMSKAKVADGFRVSQIFANQQYNSANQYYRTPPASSHNIDHIFADPGVGMRAWSQVLQLSAGKFLGVIPSDHNPVLADLTIPY
jgi:endonuclease/exonuclease/phosphatase family metal-dependent hydrolase